MLTVIQNNKHLSNKLICLFILLQPLIDVGNSLLEIPYLSFGMIVRGIFLVVILLPSILTLSKQSWISFILIVSFCAVFIVYRYFDSNALKTEFTELIKVMYFPLLLIVFHQLKIELPYSLFMQVYYLYAIILVATFALNIGSSSYLPQDNKLGFISIFSSPNEISAILIGLSPFVFIELQKIKIIIIKILGYAIVLCVSLLIGTKVMLFGTLLIFSIFTLRYIKKRFFYQKSMKYFYLSIIAIITIIITIIPFTPVGNNLQVALDFYNVDSIGQALTFDIFDKVIMGRRLQFLNDTIQVLKQGTPLQWLIGLGYAAEPLKTIEIDIFDIFCRLGAIGLLVYGTSCWLILKKYQYEFPQILSLGLLLLVSLFAGHVFNAPPVSIYLACIPFAFNHETRNWAYY